MTTWAGTRQLTRSNLFQESRERFRMPAKVKGLFRLSASSMAHLDLLLLCQCQRLFKCIPKRLSSVTAANKSLTPVVNICTKIAG